MCFVSVAQDKNAFCTNIFGRNDDEIYLTIFNASGKCPFLMLKQRHSDTWGCCLWHSQELQPCLFSPRVLRAPSKNTFLANKAQPSLRYLSEQHHFGDIKQQWASGGSHSVIPGFCSHILQVQTCLLQEDWRRGGTLVWAEIGVKCWEQSLRNNFWSSC